MDTEMTTFQIPEGKVVDWIELEACEGKATLNIIYKEDRPKEKKRVVVVCETDEPSCLYFSNLTGELTCMMPSAVPDPRYYVRMKQSESGEFVVLPSKVLDELLVEVATEINEVCDTPSDSFAHTEAVASVRVRWGMLHRLLSERK